MKYLFILLTILLFGCLKKKEETPVYIVPINDPIELEDEDLEDLPEAGDTGSY